MQQTATSHSLGNMRKRLGLPLTTWGSQVQARSAHVTMLFQHPRVLLRGHAAQQHMRHGALLPWRLLQAQTSFAWSTACILKAS